MKSSGKREETGVALPLAIVMVLLIGVMGAGLLTFVVTDLTTASEANSGQRALEMSDAGVQAARNQLDDDARLASYNGDSGDIQWSAAKTNSDPSCSGLGGRGVCLSNLDGDSATRDAALVTISSPETGKFTVISTGRFNDSVRRVEAKFGTQLDGVSIPPTYFSRTSVDYGGTADARGISLFSLGNISFSGAGDISDDRDGYFRRWATHSTADESYPNPYNQTARTGSAGIRGGAAALGSVTGLPSSWDNNRVFDNDTTVRMVPNWSSSTRSSSQKISFPFDTSRTTLDRDIAKLRARAQQLEAENPGFDYYRSGLSDTQLVSSWPATLAGDSPYETVVFYDFSTYSSSNVVNLNLGDGSCTDPASKGVIVVVNGNYSMSGSTKFGGGVVVYTGGSDSTDRGTFTSRGSSCLVGYANTTGRIDSRGTPGAGSVPALNSLSSFDGSIGTTGWRELYE